MLQRSASLVALLLLSIFPVALPTAPTYAAERCFPETGYCIDGRIRQFWEDNGGLAVFGLPISGYRFIRDRERNQSLEVQYFERNRLEYHFTSQLPYDVMLGRLGDERLRQLGIDWQTLPKADPNAPHYFAATGHAIAHPPFWNYWSKNGLNLGDQGVSERESLALFGYPISEATMEVNQSGDTVLTQWFERARFEDHGPKGVLLGLLNSEIGIDPNIGMVGVVPRPVTPPAPVTTPVPARATPVPAPRVRCHASYPDVCIPPPPPDLDCGQISYRRFRVNGSDPHRFDGDNDGIGCE